MWHYDIRMYVDRSENCKSILHDWHIIYTNANDSMHSIYFIEMFFFREN